MPNEHILLVEDDAAIRTGLEAKLRLDGYQVTAHVDGAAARRWLESALPDLIVLDWMMPKLGGLSLLEWLRRKNSTLPVLIISARDREEQKVTGLRAGADDYLAKPFGLAEFIARVEALLRRVRAKARVVRFADVEIDLERSRITRAGAEVTLSRKELDLLLFLARHANQVLAREAIQNAVWGETQVSDARAVDYHMLHLRRKLEADPQSPRHLITRHGLGYELVSDRQI
ncbi:MAG: response regulator transcription factor [Planctomycetota bacterium]